MYHLRRSIYRWIIGWALITDGIVTVLSLGFVRPQWSVRLMLQAMTRPKERQSKIGGTS